MLRCNITALPLLAGLLLCACGDNTLPQKPVQAQPVPMQLQETTEYSGDNAYVHCAALCKIGPRHTGTAGYKAQLAYLTQHLQKAGWSVTPRPFTLSNGARMVNLHATFGDATATRPILVTCHIDTKQGVSPDFVGADDGASAAAAMLELARILAATPQKASAVELVFFDGEESFAWKMTEEDGLYGSRYDVMRRGENLPRYQLNLDMVGGRNKTIAVPLLDTSEEMLAVYEAVIEELKLSERRWTVHPGGYMDDHLPFEKAGVKSLNLICDFMKGNWWHTERDTMERICPDSLQETGNVVLALLNKLIGCL